ncbi:MAG: TniQ family protein [Blautia hansenii]
MNKKLLDVLEPYEEECLFSWIIRMANYQCAYYLPEYKRKKYKDALFGIDAGTYPYLYFEPHLSNLIENISLPKSAYFANEVVLLNKMTVYPFYASFLKAELKKEVIKRLTEGGGQIRVIPGLYLVHQKGAKQFIKYCPKCVEKYGMYLIREHQIPENEVCFEHQLQLKTIPYEPDWDKLNFVVNIANLQEKDGFEIIQVDEKNVKFQLALLIHQVFQEGLKEDICIIKGKIRKKLKELGYLEYKNYSMAFDEFYIDLELEEYFLSKERVVNFILKGCFEVNTKGVVSSVDYLFIIYKLFGSLDDLYKYKISEEEVRKDIDTGNLQKSLDLKIKTGINYMPAVSYALKHEKTAHQILNYCAEGRIEGAIRVGEYWFVPKNSKYPEDKRFGSHKNDSSGLETKGHYLSTKEYAKKHHRTFNNVCYLCRKGRIKNAIKVQGRWLIPEDAPYPLEKRFKD